MLSEKKFTVAERGGKYYARLFEPLSVFGIIDTGDRTADGATLAYIDEDFNVIENMSAAQFAAHPAFKFVTETDDAGNEWVRVPKTYTKRGLAPSGTQYAGKQYFLISDTAKEGFSLSPAFKDMGVEKDSFAVSAYRIANDGSGNPVSKADMADWTNIVIGDAQNQAAKLGHMYDVYKHSHIAFLAAVEKKTFNVIPMADMSVREKCEYRGIHDFCYGPTTGTNVEWLDGIKTTSTKRLQIWNSEGNRGFYSSNIIHSTSGYIKTLQTGGVFDHVFVPDQINANTSDCMIPCYSSFTDASCVCGLYFIVSNDIFSGSFSIIAVYDNTSKASTIGFRAAKY